MVIVIDTANQIQDNEYLKTSEDTKAKLDDWKDYGVDILHLQNHLKNEAYRAGGELIDILGREGTGKTVGCRTLDPDTTVILNTDRKPLSFPGAKKNYILGKNYFIPKTYSEVREFVTAAADMAIKKKDPLYIFSLWHLEDYKDNEVTRQRKKVLGRMATKFNINGQVVHTYYTKVKSTASGNEYILQTQNDGFNTARSPMGMWDKKEIPNDYKMIIDKIKEYNEQ